MSGLGDFPGLLALYTGLTDSPTIYPMHNARNFPKSKDMGAASHRLGIRGGRHARLSLSGRRTDRPGADGPW